MERKVARILVTGGAGYLGAHVVLALRAEGYRVTSVDDLSSGSAAHGRFPDHFVRLDLRDRSALATLMSHERTDAVVHLAGRHDPTEAMTRPEVTCEVNLAGTAALLGAMRSAGVRLLLFGSDLSIYGDAPELPATEATPLDLVSPLAWVHAQVEALLDHCRRAWALKAVSLRFGHLGGADPVHGAGDTGPRAHRIVARLVEAAHRNDPSRPFEIEGTGPDADHRPPTIDLLAVSDAAQAVVSALAVLPHDAAPPPVVNVSTGRPTRLDELVRIAVAVVGHPFPVVRVPLRPGTPATLYADSAAFRSWTGWSPSRSDPETVVRSAWDFYLGESATASC